MKERDLQIDRSCHVVYSKPCKKQIQEKIAKHYPASVREEIWEKVQQQYVDFLRTGGRTSAARRTFITAKAAITTALL